LSRPTTSSSGTKRYTVSLEATLFVYDPDQGLLPVEGNDRPQILQAIIAEALTAGLQVLSRHGAAAVEAEIEV